MRWGVQQRLEYIEFKLYWEGKINRKDIMDTFNVSVPQASSDIRKYLEAAPDNMYYDKKNKYYLPTKNFKAKFNLPNANSYLSNLLLYSFHSEENSFIDMPSVHATIPVINRGVDAEILRIVLKGIRENKAIQINYQSLSRQSPAWRWICPHALAFDGFRWHTRAFCKLREQFLDFNLGRIIRIKNEKDSDIDSSDDTLWHTQTKLVIAPHPKLTKDQKKIIERDYCMKNAKIEIPIKAALVNYALFRFRLEEGHEKKNPKHQNIVLLNYEEIKPFLFINQ